MKKILTLFLCFALICSLSVSAFAAGTPEPFYLNESLYFDEAGGTGLSRSEFIEISSLFETDILYFQIDDFFFAYSPYLFVEDSYVYGDESVLYNNSVCNLAFMFSAEYSGGEMYLPCSDCPEGPHPHSVAIYDEYPFASSAPASDAPAFIAATGDGFKMMNSITAGIMGNPVLLFLLAASLIPVGIALFKALKNAVSRK